MECGVLNVGGKLTDCGGMEHGSSVCETQGSIW